MLVWGIGVVVWVWMSVRGAGRGGRELAGVPRAMMMLLMMMLMLI